MAISENILETIDDNELDCLLTSSSDYEAWRKERPTYIGGSDAAAILGVSKYSSAYQVWAEKRGLIPFSEDNEFTEFGKDFEPLIAQKFVQKTGLELLRNIPLIRHPKYDFLGCNLDGIVLHEDGTRSGFEAKTFGDRSAHRWGQDMTDQVPREYVIQCQHNMMVAGLPDMWLFAFNRGDCTYHLYHLTADAECQGMLLEILVPWWPKHMLEGDAPDPDESDSCTEALKARYCNGNGLEKVASEEIEVDCRRLQRIKAEIKALEKEEQLLSNIIREFMGECTELKLSFSQKPLTWRNNKSSEKIAWEEVAADYRAVLERRRVLVARSLDRLRFQRTTVKPGARVLLVPPLEKAA